MRMNTMKNKLVMPIVKWVGGKRQLITDIESNLPSKFNTYHEPFFGGGALLFHLQPKKAVINDYNEDLMNTYLCVKEYPDKLIESLKKHLNTSEYFYEIRDKDRTKSTYKKMNIIEKSSRLIYLNKTCYNGLFRVNSSGQFNTPFGGYKNPNIVNEPTLKAVSKYFNDNDITILHGDYQDTLSYIHENDLVYLDPPYDPVSDTASFTGYSEIGFNKEDQIKLRDFCVQIHNRGAYFLLSNSATDFIKELYKEFHIEIVKAKRPINSIGSKRGEIDEVLVRNYKI